MPEYSGGERRHTPYCPSHEQEAARINTISEVVAALGAQMKMLVRVLAWCAVFLTGVLGWSLTSHIGADKRLVGVSGDILGIQKDITNVRALLNDHETRLRRVENGRFKGAP